MDIESKEILTGCTKTELLATIAHAKSLADDFRRSGDLELALRAQTVVIEAMTELNSREAA